MRAHIAAALNQDGHEFDRQFNRPDGTTFNAVVRLNVVGHGRKTLLQAIIRDLTGSQRLEECIRVGEERFRNLFEISNDAIMLLDEKGFFDCNPATLAFFELPTKEQFCQSHPAHLSPPEQPDGTESTVAANRRIEQAYREGSARFEWVYRTMNGRDFPCEVSLQRMPLEGREILQEVVRDITERKRV